MIFTMGVKIRVFVGFVVLCSFSQAHGDALDTKIRLKRGTCGGSYNSEQGTIESPNYPSYYNAYESCSWFITVPQGSRILLSFTAFQLESSGGCDFDSLKVYDGPDSNSALVSTFCGSNIPDPFESSGNTIALKFRSDGSGQFRGFKAEFRKVNNCGGDLTDDQGDVTSPNYPQNYGDNEQCTWHIVVPERFQIRLRFRSFRLESSYACEADYLKILDGPNAQSKPLEKICGTDYPTEIVSSGNRVSLVFVSDKTANYRGFSVQYTKVKLRPLQSMGRRNIPVLSMVGAIVFSIIFASSLVE